MLDISNITDSNFEEKALEIFRFQSDNCQIYQKYLNFLDVKTNTIRSIDEIPFLPIELFKKYKVYASRENPDLIFSSSGTTGSTRSLHYVADQNLYIKSFIAGFEKFYGNLKNIRFLALLPSYQENKQSSLLYMVNFFIENDKSGESQYLPNNIAEVTKLLKIPNDKTTVLMGVSYALLDLAEQFPQNLSTTIIMETGGMKGRRKELTRAELHQKLTTAFSVKTIHSEYGMTELLSQAYSKGNGIFKTPPWMKVFNRPINEPFSAKKIETVGVLKVIDLANQYSCSFIETSDLCKIYKDNSFEVLGRLDNSDLRGCNLLIS